MKSYLVTDEEYFDDFIRVEGLPGFEDLVVLVLCDAASIELLRRGRAVPVRAPVAQAMVAYPCAEAIL